MGRILQVMQKHIRVYREFFEIGDQDLCGCERCDSYQGGEIHHIHSRGLPGFVYEEEYYDINDILNLIYVCRVCHDLAHGGGLTKEELFVIHKKKIEQKLAA